MVITNCLQVVCWSTVRAVVNILMVHVNQFSARSVNANVIINVEGKEVAWNVSITSLKKALRFFCLIKQGLGRRGEHYQTKVKYGRVQSLLLNIFVRVALMVLTFDKSEEK